MNKKTKIGDININRRPVITSSIIEDTIKQLKAETRALIHIHKNGQPSAPKRGINWELFSNRLSEVSQTHRQRKANKITTLDTREQTGPRCMCHTSTLNILNYRKLIFWCTATFIALIHIMLYSVIAVLLEQHALDTIPATTFISASVIESMLIFKVMTDRLFVAQREQSDEPGLQQQPENIVVKKDGATLSRQFKQDDMGIAVKTVIGK